MDDWTKDGGMTPSTSKILPKKQVVHDVCFPLLAGAPEQTVPGRRMVPRHRAREPNQAKPTRGSNLPLSDIVDDDVDGILADGGSRRHLGQSATPKFVYIKNQSTLASASHSLITCQSEPFEAEKDFFSFILNYLQFPS
jgi:hypothetical protein